MLCNAREFCYISQVQMEESDSGLFHHLGKVACSKGHREFESLLLRRPVQTGGIQLLPEEVLY